MVQKVQPHPKMLIVVSLTLLPSNTLEIYKTELLMKHKMRPRWLNTGQVLTFSFFALFLWSKIESRLIKKPKKECANIQPS